MRLIKIHGMIFALFVMSGCDSRDTASQPTAQNPNDPSVTITVQVPEGAPQDVAQNLIQATPTSSPSPSQAQVEAPSPIPRSALADLPVACIEDLVPSASTDEYKWDLNLVKTHKKDIYADWYKDAWTYVQATQDAQDKIDTVYAAADQYDMPPHVLLGALLQEMGLQDASLTPDFGNYACGVGQLNVSEWCFWATDLSESDQKSIGWPIDLINGYKKSHPSVDICSWSFLHPTLAKPFHDIETKRMQAAHPGSPDYMLDHAMLFHPKPIQFEEVSSALDEIVHGLAKNDPRFDGATDKDSQLIRYAITREFAEHCWDHRNGIPALAHAIKAVYDRLPEEFKNTQRYSAAMPRLPSKCKRTPKTDAFPLQVGWLLADATYNAGDQIIDGVALYRQMKNIAWEDFSPQDLFDGIQYSLGIVGKTMAPIAVVEAKYHIRHVANDVAQPGHVFVVKKPAPPQGASSPTPSPSDDGSDDSSDD